MPLSTSLVTFICETAKGSLRINTLKTEPDSADKAAHIGTEESVPEQKEQ